MRIGQDLWVFGYGSLMWRPGFPFLERTPARLDGWRRGFFIYSTHHRGTPERPGLVLGLDRGGVCHGIAYRVAARDAHQVLGYLSAREQVNGVYREVLVPLALTGAERRCVRALAYVVERAHPSFAGELALGEQRRLIRGARGISGPNLDYLINTVHQLDALGIREARLNRLLACIGPHFARGPEAAARPGCRALLACCRAAPVAAPRLRQGERRRFIWRRKIAELGRGRLPAVGA
jgi:cation transport protein ChaC